MDSLTRQAEPLERHEGEEHREFEEIVERQDATQFQDPGSVPMSQPKISKHRGLAATLVVFGGLVIVWVYGSVTKTYDLSFLNRLIQDAVAQLVFANPAQAGVISVTLLLVALWVRHRRRNPSQPAKGVASPSLEV